MHVFLGAEDSIEALRAELARCFPGATWDTNAPGLFASTDLPPATIPLPPVVFARQVLTDALPLAAASIRGFADRLFDALAPVLPEAQPWRLHIEPHYGPGVTPQAGRNRCQLIREALVERLRRQRRRLGRQLQEETRPFTAGESLVQLLLTGPEQGFLSVALAPVPAAQRQVLSPFPRGELPVASDRAAPCRAFAKLVEAAQRLGRQLAPGETCVDLGASPGSWSYVALRHGAQVTAVDRSPLRSDLMNDPRLRFHRGDAFAFAPAEPVDWLLCDVIAAPARSIELLLHWARERWCTHFVVTIKFKGTEHYPALDRLKAELPGICDDFLLTRLCANKNEACAMGRVRTQSTRGG